MKLDLQAYGLKDRNTLRIHFRTRGFPLHPAATTFRQAVWQILSEIPYGQTITYGEIASKIAERENISHMSAQAVGGAV